MKKILSLLLALILVFALTACGGEEAEETATPDAGLSFTLTAGEAGEYGKLITYNAGTEFEETFYAYYVPVGTYTVTNNGEYMSQITVSSDEIVVTDAGWEEAATVGDVKLLDVGASDTITVEEGMHIEIVEPSVFTLVQE